MSFKEEKEFLLVTEDSSNEVNRKSTLSKDEISKLKTTYPTLPQDYFDYLEEIGAGILREVQFDVKPYLFDFNDLGLEDIYQVDQNIKFFGDNLSGDFAGFNVLSMDDEVIEFWHDSNQLYNTGKSFRQYIKEKMLFS